MQRVFTCRVIAKLTYYGLIKPCPRPRFASSRAYLPVDYLDNQKDLINNWLVESRGFRVKPEQYPVGIEVILRGKYHQSIDCDNLLKSILDSLVKAKIIENDNIKFINKISFSFEKGDSTPIAIVTLLTN